MPSNRSKRVANTAPGSPFLTHVSLKSEKIQRGLHPFTIPLLAQETFDLRFTAPVTFLVGENGSGKSTLLGSPS